MPDADSSHNRGILTDRDRTYLKGTGEDLLGKTTEPLDVDANHERVIRSDIRERVERALVDLSLLFRYMDDDDFTQLDVELPWGDVSEEAIGFIYRFEKCRTTRPLASIETRIRSGIQEAVRREGRIADVEIGIEEREYDLDSLLEKPMEELSEAETAFLIRDERVALDFTRRDQK